MTDSDARIQVTVEPVVRVRRCQVARQVSGLKARIRNETVNLLKTKDVVFSTAIKAKRYLKITDVFL